MIDHAASTELLSFARKHIGGLHALWKEQSPEFGYYPTYQDVNEKSVALIEQLPRFRGRHLLDIGCNSGLYSCLAARSAASVLGCDVEPVLIARARSAAAHLAPHLPAGSIDFRLGSFTDALDGRFDAVLASLVLYHVGDEALARLAQFLKAHKPLVILQVRPARAEAFAAKPEWKTVSTTQKYGGMYTVEGNLEFLRDCGYENATVHGMCSTLFYGEYFPIVTAES